MTARPSAPAPAAGRRALLEVAVAAAGLALAAPAAAQTGPQPGPASALPTLKLAPVAPPRDAGADMAARIAATTDRAALLELLAAGSRRPGSRRGWRSSASSISPRAASGSG